MTGEKSWKKKFIISGYFPGGGKSLFHQKRIHIFFKFEYQRKFASNFCQRFIHLIFHILQIAEVLINDEIKKK